MDKIDYDKLEILDGYLRQLTIMQSTEHSLELDTALDEISQLYSGLMKEILSKYDLSFDNVYEDNIFTEDDNVKQELFGWLNLPIVIPDPPDIDDWTRSQVRYFRRVKSSLGL
jgi:hypothetical protein